MSSSLRYLLNKISSLHQWSIKLLGWYFYHLYHSLAWSYDFISNCVSVGRWKYWVKSVTIYLSGSVLEIGHGPGHLLIEMADKEDFFAIDESASMSRLAKRNARQKGIRSPNLIRSDGKALPFCNETFDVVVATFPAPYLFESDTLRNIERVLKKNGRLVILISAAIGGNSILEQITHWVLQFSGETPPKDQDFLPLINRLFYHGLHARITWERYQKDELLMIFATKS